MAREPGFVLERIFASLTKQMQCHGVLSVSVTGLELARPSRAGLAQLVAWRHALQARGIIFNEKQVDCMALQI